MNDPSAVSNKKKPWYRQPWLWLVLTPLIAVIIMSAISVTLAVNGADTLVRGNYKKEGRLYVSTEESSAVDDAAAASESATELEEKTVKSLDQARTVSSGEAATRE